MVDVLQGLGLGLGYFAVALLCLAGVVMSALGLSGTWCVPGAALLAHLLRGHGFPGWTTIILFLLCCLAAEVVESLAGAWGIKRRGGSNWAGVAALLGGLAGAILGVFIPPPIIGSLIGMLIGSFLPAYLVENYRLKHAGKAVNIALGAVLARLFVVLLKLFLTLGMSIVLLIGLIL